jgi:hypothetical protein
MTATAPPDPHPAGTPAAGGTTGTTGPGPAPRRWTNLVRAEVVRLLSRRFTVVMVAVLLGAFAVTLLTTVLSTHRPTAAEIAAAEGEVQRARRDMAAQHALCQEQAEQIPEYGDCSWADPERIGIEDFLDGVFVFSASIEGLIFFLVGYLALFGFLVGASSVGAELTSGGMTNLLLWRPERTTVLATKLAVLCGAVLVLSVIATAVYLSVFWALAQVAGLPGDTGGTFWAELVQVCLRGLVLALVAAALGFAVATLGRHTAAAVGLLAGYAVVWEIGARIVLEVVRADAPGLWMLSTYLGAWLEGDVTIDRFCLDGGCSDITITWQHAGILLAVLLAGGLGAAFADFRRRDLA